MRVPTSPAIALLLALSPAAALAEDPPEKLREQVLEGAMLEQTRLRAAMALERADPEMLGGALLEMAEKQKSPGNLGLLVQFTIQEEVRHLRVLAVYAAWMSAPDQALAAYLARTDAEDDKQAMRAVEAAGLIAPLVKDRAAANGRFLEIARGKVETSASGEEKYFIRTFPAIEAARALNRAMERRMERDLVDAALSTVDNHVRKHLVWAVMDLQGSDRSAVKTFEGLKGRKGSAGKNAAECADILLDKQALPFAWNPNALRDVGTWWRTGRARDLRVEVAIGDQETKGKVEGWFAEMRKETPAWEHLASSSFQKVALRTNKEPEIFDLRKRTILIDASEIARCETPWQGTYVLARDAGIALSAILGEPSAGHRGWEPAYVDLHAFMKATKRGGGKLDSFVDEAIGKKPWP